MELNTERQPADQAALFADLPVDATVAAARTAIRSIKARVSARLTAFHVEMLALADVAETGEAVLGVVDLGALRSAVWELGRRLTAEITRRDGF